MAFEIRLACIFMKKLHMKKNTWQVDQTIPSFISFGFNLFPLIKKFTSYTYLILSTNLFLELG